MDEISIVIPVHNEAENIKDLVAEINQVCAGRYNYEIIVIDDGSTDGTFEIIKTLNHVKCIRFRRCFGQTAAMDAGIKHSKYKYIVTLDGDGQNDPNDIPGLIEYLEKNDLDIVSGWRKKRKDSFFKRFVSRGANFLRSILIHDEIHDSGCSLKVYKKECFDQVSLYGEMHRFIPAILKIKGFNIGEIEVNHRPRLKGKTKYNWRRTFKGFIDMISVWFWNKYAVKPLHLLGGMGLLSIFLGFLTLAYTVYLYISIGKVGLTAWPVLSVFLFLIGILLFVLGLIADILSKNYYETTRDNSYTIKEIVEF
jgi:glycosyltransferase involved in cell wall biosynthesis